MGSKGNQCLESLNRILAADQRYTQIVAPELKGAHLLLQSKGRWMTPEAVLWPIAEAVAKLLCEENFARIKVCEGCSLVFVDRTPGVPRKICYWRSIRAPCPSSRIAAIETNSGTERTCRIRNTSTR